MQQLNPLPSGQIRPKQRLCNGQTLLCKALGLKVRDWDQKQLITSKLTIEDVDYQPQHILQTTRLGIPIGRDEHLPYRFILAEMVRYCTRPPKSSLDIVQD